MGQLNKQCVRMCVFVKNCRHTFHLDVASRDFVSVRVCGGRVVILLYCPSCFLMETGLYWYLRQIFLRADVDWALLLFSTVCPAER